MSLKPRAAFTLIELSMVLVIIALLIGGVVVTESVYAIPGLGRLTVDAVLARDFPTIQGVILLFSFVYVLVNLLVDLSYVFFDPQCPHCAVLWKSARPLKSQARFVWIQAEARPSNPTGRPLALVKGRARGPAASG